MAAAARRHRVRAHVLALAGYLLLTLIMTWPLVTHFSTAIPGDGFDGWQNYWNQWWIKVALVDEVRNPLRTDRLFHPTGVTLYFHTLNPFNGITTLPVQLAFGLIPAYNAVVLLAWVLGGYGVFLLTLWVLKVKDLKLKIGWSSAPNAVKAPLADRKTTDQHAPTIDNTRSSINLHYPAAFLAGAIFTFSPFHMAHLLGHMQVMSLQWLSFYILYLLRTLGAVKYRRPWLRESGLAAFFLILVGLCDWYFVLYLVLFTGLAVLWIWLTGPAAPGRSGSHSRMQLLELGRLLMAPLWIGAIFFGALSFWLVPMLRETRAFSFMVRPAQDLYILSASVMDFLVPNRLHTLFRPASFGWIGNQVAPVSERTIGIGYVALVLAMVGALAGRKRVGLWIIGAVFFFLMALGPVIHLGNITAADIPDVVELPLHFTPFGILAYFSEFVRLSRSVSRYAVMVQLCVAVLAGVGAAALAARVRTRRIHADPAPSSRTGQAGPAAVYLPALLLILILAEYWAVPYPLTPPDTPTWYAALAAEPGDGAVLNLPMNYDRPGYLLYQTLHQRALTVAYISRDDPRTLTERAPVLQHFRHLGPDILDVDPVAVGMTVLADLDVEYVVVDRYKMPGGEERSYTDALAAAIFAGQPPVYEDDRITVYRVQPPAEMQSYPVLGALNWGPLTTGARTLAGPARLEIHHAPADAQLRIRYRTTSGATALLDAGTDRSELTPAANGHEIVVPLSGLSDGTPLSVTLFPKGSGDVTLEAIEVLPKSITR